MDLNFLRSNYVRIRLGGPPRKGEESLTYREAYVLKILKENGIVYKNLLIRKYDFPPKIANEVLERLRERNILESDRREGKNIFKPTDYGKLLTRRLSNLYMIRNKDFKPLPRQIIENHRKGINFGGGEFEIRYLRDTFFSPTAHMRIWASFRIGSYIPYVRSTKGIPFIMFE